MSSTDIDVDTAAVDAMAVAFGTARMLLLTLPDLTACPLLKTNVVVYLLWAFVYTVS